MNLRQMTMEDADKMLEWKNYAETRRLAIKTRAEIKREDHIKFLAENLSQFQIIRVEGEVVGAVRIKDNEISIWIDRKFWGYGFATEAIKIVSVKGMTAKIVCENIASMRAFIKAGYLPKELVRGEHTVVGQINYYIFQL